jgi:hypothetical protein
MPDDKEMGMKAAQSLGRRPRWGVSGGRTNRNLMDADDAPEHSALQNLDGTVLSAVCPQITVRESGSGARKLMMHGSSLVLKWYEAMLAINNRCGPSRTSKSLMLTDVAWMKGGEKESNCSLFIIHRPGVYCIVGRSDPPETRSIT